MIYAVVMLFSFLLSACGPDSTDSSQQTGLEALAALTSDVPEELYTLTWDPVNDQSVQGYKVHVGISSGHYIAERDVGIVTSVPFRLPGRRVWYFAVTAYNSAGESQFSQEVSLGPS